MSSILTRVLVVRFITAALSIAALVACSEPTNGPCVVTYRDPLLTIASVLNTQTGAAIPQVRIKDIKYQGAALRELRELTETGTLVRGVTITGQELLCNVVCSFATQEGLYEFTVTQSGLRDTSLSVNAKYATSEGPPGGCPRTFSGGMELRLRLSPTG